MNHHLSRLFKISNIPFGILIHIHIHVCVVHRDIQYCIQVRTHVHVSAGGENGPGRVDGGRSGIPHHSQASDECFVHLLGAVRSNNCAQRGSWLHRVRVPQLEEKDYCEHQVGRRRMESLVLITCTHGVHVE